MSREDIVTVTEMPREASRAATKEERTACECMMCGECRHGIDLTEKDKREARRATAKDYTAHQIEKASRSDCNTDDSVANNHIHLIELQQ